MAKRPKDKPAQKQRNNSEALKAHQFKPGQSGNPGGRPIGTSITGRLRALLDADDGALARTIVKVMVREAAKGKFAFAKEILERVDGKVEQALTLDATVTSDDIRGLPRSERIAMLEQALAIERGQG